VLRETLPEACYSLTAPDRHAARELLEGKPGVLAVQPSGADLHLFLDERQGSIEALRAIAPFAYRRVAPSLEDVFIALVKKEELARAA
jgi:hypothetical protein